MVKRRGPGRPRKAGRPKGSRSKKYKKSRGRKPKYIFYKGHRYVHVGKY